MANKLSREKREYVRAVISTDAKIAPIDPAQLERLSVPNEVMGQGNSEHAPGLENGTGHGLPPWANQMAESLRRMDEKLDRILEKLGCERSEVSPVADVTIRDISGSGVGLVLSVPVETGQILQICMSLPGFPMHSFKTYGKVVRISARKGKDKGMFDVALKFLHISEVDREQLIAYSFSAQRKAIRTVIEGESD